MAKKKYYITNVELQKGSKKEMKKVASKLSKNNVRIVEMNYYLTIS